MKAAEVRARGRVYIIYSGSCIRGNAARVFSGRFCFFFASFLCLSAVEVLENRRFPLFRVFSCFLFCSFSSVGFLSAEFSRWRIARRQSLGSEAYQYFYQYFLFLLVFLLVFFWFYQYFYQQFFLGSHQCAYQCGLHGSSFLLVILLVRFWVGMGNCTSKSYQ